MMMMILILKREDDNAPLDQLYMPRNSAEH